MYFPFLENRFFVKTENKQYFSTVFCIIPSQWFLESVLTEKKCEACQIPWYKSCLFLHSFYIYIRITTSVNYNLPLYMKNYYLTEQSFFFAFFNCVIGSKRFENVHPNSKSRATYLLSRLYHIGSYIPNSF